MLPPGNWVEAIVPAAWLSKLSPGPPPAYIEIEGRILKAAYSPMVQDSVWLLSADAGLIRPWEGLQ